MNAVHSARERLYSVLCCKSTSTVIAQTRVRDGSERGFNSTAARWRPDERDEKRKEEERSERSARADIAAERRGREGERRGKTQSRLNFRVGTAGGRRAGRARAPRAAARRATSPLRRRTGRPPRALRTALAMRPPPIVA